MALSDLVKRVGAVFSGSPTAQAERASRFQKPVSPGGPFDEGHSHRRVLWTARILAVICGMETLAIVAMAFALAALVPLKRVEIALLQVTPAQDQVVRVMPLRTDMPGIDVLTRAHVAEYVVSRNTVVPDLPTMQARLDLVRSRSTTEVWQELVEIQRQFLADAMTRRLSRSVEVLSVTRDPGRGGVRPGARPTETVWFVEFATTDTYSRPEDPGNGRKLRLRAQLVIDFRPITMRRGELDVLESTNPLGFTVLRYDVAQLAN
ncbi:MAG: hypothetical protein IBJ15_04775 [Alphaproteobacteria bacterium]|nr:hypothetical protein [Alphaproteobacteria bacterium]